MHKGSTFQTDAKTTVRIIKPVPGWVPLQLPDLWEYRELLFFLVWRDIKVHYKQMALGAVWAILQPLLMMVIFTVIFGRLASLPSENVPYPVYSFAALLPWQLFAGALARSSSSLVGNINLLTKVYFPRLVIPISAVLSGMMDFILSFFVLIGLMLWFGVTPTAAVLSVPFFVLLVLFTALAFGLWLSALNVQFRDVQFVIPFLIQAWLFASPVAYSIELVPSGPWRILYGLNPMTGVIQGFRWALVGGAPPDELLILSISVVSLLFLGGVFFFRRMEKNFADVV
ncbi:MAG: ABC transporter permease [Chloroflexi bacterium]|nr:ABC transporter permease [Chloroflexota bacterium]